MAETTPLITSLPPLLSPPTYTGALVLAVFSSVLSSFQVGLNSGILNVPESTIRRDLDLSTNEWALIVSIFCTGGLFGSLLGGKLADAIGRKNLLTSSNVLFISGALLESLSQNFWMLLMGRLIIGLGCGCSTVIVPLYLGEIAPANLRGSLGTMNQFSIVIGILVANVLGKPLGIGNDERWRYLLGIVLAPSLLQLMLASVLLESPLWLMMQDTHKSVVDAEDVLTRLRGPHYEDLEFELELLQANKEWATRHIHTSVWASLKSISARRSLLIGLSLQLFQQFSGINAVFYYSTAFFSSAHVSDPWLASVLASTINFLATALAIPLMDRAGRRTLLMLSALGMMLSCVGLTVVLSMSAGHAGSVVLSSLSVSLVLLYVTFFEIGLGPITWLIGAEVYPASIRSLGMSLASVVNWSSNFVISLSFPHLTQALRQYTFLPFAFVLAGAVLFIWGIVPETRGRSLEAIQRELGGGVGGEDGRGAKEDVSEGYEGYESDMSAGSWGAPAEGLDGYPVVYGDDEDGSSDTSLSPMSLTPVSATRGWGKGGREEGLQGVRAASR